MREILFRGKTKQGEWVYGHYLVAAGMAFISAFGVSQPIKVDCETIGQYTGLTDKNGTRIFEGDILHFRNILGGERKLVVSWGSENTSWMCGNNYTVGYIADDSEVIDNIYKEVQE